MSYEEKVEMLTDALERIMEWQVKNVKCWHNSAYDYAAYALKEVNGENNV